MAIQINWVNAKRIRRGEKKTQRNAVESNLHWNAVDCVQTAKKKSIWVQLRNKKGSQHDARFGEMSAQSGWRQNEGTQSLNLQ